MARPLVGHVVDQFLKVTETFIYGFISHLRTTRAVVFANSRANEDLFPHSPVDLYWRSLSLPERAALRAVRTFDPEINEHIQRFVLAIHAARRRPALIHAHFGWNGMRALFAKRVLRVPLLVSFYGIDMSRYPRMPEYLAELRILFREAEMFLALGERMKARLIELGCPSERIRIVRVGADLNRFTFEPRTRGPGSPIRFLFCGRFVEKKGLPFLIRAFDRVRRVLPEAELTIIGDGVLRPEIDRLIGELGVANSVRLLGFQPPERVALEMKRAHILVGPSVTAEDGDDEGGVLTCGIEGSAAGLPLIATRHADIPEQLVDDQTGLMVEERDVEGLANAMISLGRSPERWPAMGRAGRLLIEQRFDIVRETRALEETYAELISRRP